MRVIVFFDLPTETATDRHAYSQFRGFLIGEGFIMMQESVYVKLALNATVADAVKRHVKDRAPKAGIVQMMTITEKQFSDIEYVVGESHSDVVTTPDRYVLL